MSLSPTRNVTSAWPSRSLAKDIFKMEQGAGCCRPSESSNCYKRISIELSQCILIMSLLYLQTITSMHTGGSNVNSRWVHPPQRCARPCPGSCCKGKVYGQTAGRTSWGKCSAVTQKKPFRVRFSSLRKLYGTCILTSTWRAESRLSTGKSGRPRLDDSWEHRVVARDSNWDTLTNRLQQNIVF